MTRSTLLLTLSLSALLACRPSAPGEPSAPTPGAGDPPPAERVEAPAAPVDTTAIVAAPPATPAPTPALAPSGTPQQLTVELTPGMGSSSESGEGVTAQGGDRVIRIRGVMQTPNPCYRLAGAVAREGGVVVVRITGTGDPERACIASIGSIPYTAVVRGVSAGAQQVRVVHTYPGTGWPTQTALDTRVTVR
ncbi:MAG TPA: hypothetical protein VNP72_07350 [Longimicrobium sp.]|nr:hypothetical protein [Longimicrobium sp.]